jgi:small subunit ribosomal protein S20
LSGNKSAEKRERGAIKRRAANRSVKSELKTTLTRARKTVGDGSAEAAPAVREATSMLDVAAKKGVIHPNNAARHKSRLTKQLNQSEKK